MKQSQNQKINIVINNEVNKTKKKRKYVKKQKEEVINIPQLTAYNPNVLSKTSSVPSYGLKSVNPVLDNSLGITNLLLDKFRQPEIPQQNYMEIMRPPPKTYQEPFQNTITNVLPTNNNPPPFTHQNIPPPSKNNIPQNIPPPPTNIPPPPPPPTNIPPPPPPPTNIPPPPKTIPTPPQNVPPPPPKNIPKKSYFVENKIGIVDDGVVPPLPAQIRVGGDDSDHDYNLQLGIIRNTLKKRKNLGIDDTAFITKFPHVVKVDTPKIINTIQPQNTTLPLPLPKIDEKMLNLLTPIRNPIASNPPQDLSSSLGQQTSPFLNISPNQGNPNILNESASKIGRAFKNYMTKYALDEIAYSNPTEKKNILARGRPALITKDNYNNFSDQKLKQRYNYLKRQPLKNAEFLDLLRQRLNIT